MNADEDSPECFICFHGEYSMYGKQDDGKLWRLSMSGCRCHPWVHSYCLRACGNTGKCPVCREPGVDFTLPTAPPPPEETQEDPMPPPEIPGFSRGDYVEIPIHTTPLENEPLVPDSEYLERYRQEQCKRRIVMIGLPMILSFVIIFIILGASSN